MEKSTATCWILKCYAAGLKLLYNFGLITVKSILLGRKTLTFIQRPLLYPFGNDSLLKD